ncbi:MAG: IclR family transcriptional regulator C-terminal domain-containing protein, partial [Bradyrhizobium sp.]
DAEIEAVIEVIVPRLAKSPRITPKFLRERIAVARKVGHTVLLDAAFPGMGGVGVPVRDDAGEVVAALSIGAATDRIRRRESELADMLKKEAQVLARAMAQAPKNVRPAKVTS